MLFHLALWALTCCREFSVPAALVAPFSCRPPPPRLLGGRTVPENSVLVPHVSLLCRLRCPALGSAFLESCHHSFKILEVTGVIPLKGTGGVPAGLVHTRNNSVVCRLGFV